MSTDRGLVNRAIYAFAGWVALALGFIGIFVPLLPTTPFLILAAWCFGRGSPRFQAWLFAHPWFGPPVLDWQRERAVRTRYKVLATSMVAASSAYLLSRPSFPMVVKILYSALVVLLLAYLWTRRSRRDTL